MTSASTHTSWSNEVPGPPDRQDPRRLFRHAFQEAYTSDYEEHLSPKHQQELGLTLAELLHGRDGNEVRSRYVYDPLSTECEKAVKALDGSLTQGVVSDDSLFSIESNRERYFEDGEWKFRCLGPTLYRTGYLIDALYAYQQEWGVSAPIMAEAGDQWVNGEDDALLESIAHPKFLRSQALPTVPGGAVQRRDGKGAPAGLARRGVPCPFGLGTNGLGNTPTDDPENRRSERSDGTNEVDVSAVNPPVEARCNRRQWAWLTTASKTLSEQWVFLHVEHCQRAGSYSSGEDEDDWVVIEHKELHKRFGVPYPTETMWRESDLIEPWEGGRYISPEEAEERGIESKARKFRIKQEALERWAELGAEGGMRRYKGHRRKLIRTSEPATMTTDTMTDSDNRYPELIDRAVRILKEADHEIILGAIEDAEEAIAGREGAEARDRLTSLRLAKETVKRQVIQVQDGVAELQNAYTVQEISGRTGFKRGGPQGLMGEVKARAYDIEGITNYDISECHTSALRQVAKKLEAVGVDIDISPWEQYPGKRAVAADTGLPISLIKIVEHAVKYGAVIPLSISQAEDYFEEVCGYKISIAEEVKKCAEKGLIDDPDEALRTLHDIFEPMRQVVKRIAKALLDDYYQEKQRGGYIHNACGISFCPSRHTQGHDREAAVMAWMLQGLEAAFIHSLTILSADSDDFSVFANEHDGCITKGEIPQEAIEVARHMSGFHEAELVEKAFADEEDVEALYGGDEEEAESNGEQGETNADAVDDHDVGGARGDAVPGAPRPPTPTGMGAAQPPAHTDAPGDDPEPDGDPPETDTAEPPDEAYHPCPDEATREQVENWAALQRGEEDLYGAPATRAYQQKYGHDGMGEIPDPDQL